MRHKQIIRDNKFNSFNINTGKNNEYNCYGDILTVIDDRFKLMTSTCSKTLFIRFDLRFPENYLHEVSNRHVEHLYKMIMDKSRYHDYGVQYVWGREQPSKERHQHYHCIALINGNKCQNYYSFLKGVEKSWNHVLGVQNGEGLVHFCDKEQNGIIIKKPSKASTGSQRLHQERQFQETLNRCFHWASYLAKECPQNIIPHGVRRFGASQL
ncbi:inovirus-type Gp2 protein [Maridesulfovibrio ferrireducens]|uniref:YagK/YfjJ domain-containing protein n=1 Tax=Maridesulfovibrio ferrireducens TaxID=246191 RepID=UPI001A296B28|nr:inovirus-type Gp2 protein [Maridesulfovibrio ferrireducens]MBI9113184.1 inovirus-type Gp2 protein [Maridesulfovibrio ferrireducens]